MGAPRVWLRITEDALRDGVVDRASVRLTTHGAGNALQVGLDAAAALVFGAAYINNASSPDAPAHQAFARLEGRVWVDETGLQFTLPAAATFTYDVQPADPNDADAPPHWSLKLNYDVTTFLDAELAPLAHDLILPLEPPGAQHLELAALLEVEGIAQGTLALGGVLDVPLQPINGVCEIHVHPLSPNGSPEAATLELLATDGSLQRKKTVAASDADAEGLLQVRFEKLNRKRSYSLIYTGEDGIPLKLFEDVPYAQLANMGSPADDEMLSDEDEPPQETTDTTPSVTWGEAQHA